MEDIDICLAPVSNTMPRGRSQGRMAPHAIGSIDPSFACHPQNNCSDCNLSVYGVCHPLLSPCISRALTLISGAHHNHTALELDDSSLIELLMSRHFGGVSLEFIETALAAFRFVEPSKV